MDYHKLVVDTEAHPLDSVIELEILKVICDECEKQGVGPWAVIGMALAWNDAITLPTDYLGDDLFTLDDVKRWAYMIEPETKGEYRVVPVVIDHQPAGAPVNEIAERMEKWMERMRSPDILLTPAEAWREFEEIHPFADGNGRVGCIVYNFLNNSITPCGRDRPELPPNFHHEVGWIHEHNGKGECLV